MAGGIGYVLEESAQFFWYRFFFNVLDRLQHTEIAKLELISRLRDYANIIQLNQLGLTILRINTNLTKLFGGIP